jgi:phosphoribosylcarboxyaminoimidazole (NCAIR) mutase
MKIFNGTPHSVNVVTNGTFSPEIRKFIADVPEIIATILSNGVLSAKIDTITAAPINGIPVFEKKISGCDELPEGYDIYIVSALYVSTARVAGMDTSKLYTIADPVYSLDGKTIHGSRGICPAF